MSNLIIYFATPIIVLFSKGYLPYDEELIIVICICIVLFTLISIFGDSINQTIISISTEIYDFYREKLDNHTKLCVALIQCINNIDRARITFLTVYVTFLNNIYLFYSVRTEMQFLFFKMLTLESLFNFGIEENILLKELTNYKHNLYVKKIYDKVTKIYLS